ncbi:MAG: ATP-binding protein [Peptococcaceae bacterium]|nr:ATP-binding protein [Peptococcaceae bacterium]
MTQSNIPVSEITLAARGLTVYRGIQNDLVFASFLRFWEAVAREKEAGDILDAYGELFFRLAEAAPPAGRAGRTGDAWRDHLLELILLDDNAFTRGLAAAPPEELGTSLTAAAAADLRRLQKLFVLDAGVAGKAVLDRLGAPSGDGPPGLPGWSDLGGAPGPEGCGGAGRFATLKKQMAAAPDWGELIPLLAEFHRQNGSGIFAAYTAFRWLSGERRLAGIARPDPVRLEDLVGYRTQREEVLANTEKFLAGFPANNMLLYGDRGTGKSSTVKALLSEYAGRGLRLVEIAKRDLGDFNAVTAILRRRPQRFILFVDDLSFEETEVEYKELKAILEGGLESRPANVLIYATSNRRHLVKELFSDRDAAPARDEVRRNDTVQEKLSLVDRFGITVLFATPDRGLYLEIVRHLARQKGIPLSEDEIESRALQWEIWHNGRSGRTARQFVDHLAGECALAGSLHKADRR